MSIPENPNDRVVVKVSAKEAKEILKEKKLREKPENSGIGISIDALRLSFLVFLLILGSTITYYTYWGDPSVIPSWKHDASLLSDNAYQTDFPELSDLYSSQNYASYLEKYRNTTYSDSVGIDIHVAYLASLLATEQLEAAYTEAFRIEGKTLDGTRDREKVEWLRIHIAVERAGYREAQFLLEKLSKSGGRYADISAKYLEEVNDFLSPEIW